MVGTRPIGQLARHASRGRPEAGRRAPQHAQGRRRATLWDVEPAGPCAFWTATPVERGVSQAGPRPRTAPLPQLIAVQLARRSGTPRAGEWQASPRAGTGKRGAGRSTGPRRGRRHGGWRSLWTTPRRRGRRNRHPRRATLGGRQGRPRGRGRWSRAVSLPAASARVNRPSPQRGFHGNSRLQSASVVAGHAIPLIAPSGPPLLPRLRRLRRGPGAPSPAARAVGLDGAAGRRRRALVPLAALDGRRGEAGVAGAATAPAAPAPAPAPPKPKRPPKKPRPARPPARGVA